MTDNRSKSTEITRVGASQQQADHVSMPLAVDDIRARLLELGREGYFGDVIIRISAGRFAWWTEKREMKPGSLKRS